MKSATILRKILLSAPIFSPLVMMDTSSAFCLGMKRHHTSMGGRRRTAVSLQHQTTSEDDDYEFDFLEAATQAAMERERTTTPRTLQPNLAPPKQHDYQTEPTSTQPLSRNNDNESYEFDFLEAATRAATERELAAKNKSKNNYDVEASFRIYPSVSPSAQLRSFESIHSTVVQ